ncbi:MAG: hypothetical protein GC129_03325 [Proteobacteria bacterium]|nr:hypothetical protein [Pseudomonadota bacterium]
MTTETETVEAGTPAFVPLPPELKPPILLLAILGLVTIASSTLFAGSLMTNPWFANWLLRLTYGLMTVTAGGLLYCLIAKDALNRLFWGALPEKIRTSAREAEPWLRSVYEPGPLKKVWTQLDNLEIGENKKLLHERWEAIGLFKDLIAQRAALAEMIRAEIKRHGLPLLLVRQTTQRNLVRDWAMQNTELKAALARFQVLMTGMEALPEWLLYMQGEPVTRENATNAPMALA